MEKLKLMEEFYSYQHKTFFDFLTSSKFGKPAVKCKYKNSQPLHAP